MPACWTPQSGAAQPGPARPRGLGKGSQTPAEAKPSNRPYPRAHRQRRRAAGVTSAIANREAGRGGPLVFEFGGRGGRALRVRGLEVSGGPGGGRGSGSPAGHRHRRGAEAGGGPWDELFVVGREASLGGWAGLGLPAPGVSLVLGPWSVAVLRLG